MHHIFFRIISSLIVFFVTALCVCLGGGGVVFVCGLWIILLIMSNKWIATCIVLTGCHLCVVCLMLCAGKCTTDATLCTRSGRAGRNSTLYLDVGVGVGGGGSLSPGKNIAFI